MRIFGIGVTHSVNPPSLIFSINEYFQTDNYWYIFCKEANRMDKKAQITIAMVTDKGISSKSDKMKNLSLSLYLPLEYSCMESSRLHLAYTANIFEDGLLMCTPEELDIGQTLRVKIYYDSAAELDPVHTLGKVISVDKLEKPEKAYRCAVRFVDPPSDLLKKNRKFLMSLY